MLLLVALLFGGLLAALIAEHDERLHRIVHEFIEADRAILGICYGHQMIARAIAGDQACPERLTKTHQTSAPCHPVFYTGVDSGDRHSDRRGSDQ